LQLIGERYRTNRVKEEEFVLRYTWRSARMVRAQPPSIVTVPVVVHVVYNNSTQNVSNSQIESQIRILNEDYRKTNADSSLVPDPFKPLAADARIEFKLACKDPEGNDSDGITRTSTNIQSFEIPPEGSPLNAEKVKFTSEGGRDAWDTTRYVNLWVCRLANSPTGGQLLGYAQFPGGPLSTDGVAIHYEAFGDIGTANPPFDKGRTATHEVGHYFDLFHIWGDDQFLSDPCSGTDNVTDTPNQKVANVGKPTFPETMNSCPGTGPNGTLFLNYMDYTDDDSMYMFTMGQVIRMRAALDGSRSSLRDSNALVCSGAESRETMSRMLPERVYNGADKMVNLADLL
jgi:hypothetical protein